MFSIISRMSSAALLAAGAIVLSGAPCAAGVIGFNSNQHGQIIGEQFAGMGVHISAVNFRGGPDLAIVFDTRVEDTRDTDLESPWLLGNISPSSNQAGILIIAENATDANRDGLIDHPDDQAAPLGSSSGEMRIRFDFDLASFGFDLFDSEGGAEINSNVGFIAFRDNGVEKKRVSFGEFITPTSAHYDPTIAFGDHSANRIRPISAARLGIDQFDEIRINTASGGIDTLTWTNAVPIPEPAGLGVLAFSALAITRRRRLV